MKYNHIVQGKFLARPNRFIAHVEINGQQETVHVKNTGRCKELLVSGATVYLEKSSNPERKTAYDLVAVEKGTRMVNMDSQAPNKVVEEWLYTKALFPNLINVRPETTYGNSRFDFYVETEDEKILIEVKGVTLEQEGVVRFPDAPSIRAVKHVEELVQAHKAGYKTYVIFVIQMEGVKYFSPNIETHPQFGEALMAARRNGVEMLAYDCTVTPQELMLKEQVPIYLEEILFKICNPLLTWYDTHRRILPWRETPTPYRVWVSEIMLQQTRVEAVKPYFERFMNALPDIGALAAAEEEELLKLWEGLGYYNRVRNMQKAAIQIMEEYNGYMPDSYEELLTLKGIGSYTAGAIASIAFGRAVPAVDGNVLRVISRVRMDAALITDAKVKRKVEEDLIQIMPQDRPGDFNQAIMEIGACVCIPNGAPRCQDCPLQDICMAHAANRELEFPKKAAKKKRKIEEKTILIIRDENKAALNKRPNKGLLAGMYELPTLEGYKTAEDVIQYLAESGLQTLYIQPLIEAKHIFTHKEWHMKGYMVRVDELEHKALNEESEQWLFIEPQETLKKYPIPAAYAAYTNYLNIKLGNEKY